MDPRTTEPHPPASVSKPRISLDDLLQSESEVLRRIAEEIDAPPHAAGHSSTTSGHRSGGTHSSHTSAKPERPLADG